MSPSKISLMSMLYLTSLPLIAVFTNIYPYISMRPHDVKLSNSTLIVDWDEGLMIGVLINQSIIFIIGGLGNCLTLVAIPYVRMKYGSQFSILQLNSVVLLLQLSFVDVMYGLVVFPHLLQNYLLRLGQVDENLCYFIGFFRILLAYVDFHTIAMISCCIARHNLCRQCGEASLNHDDHDKIFGGKRVYLVCISIWVVSFFTVLPDVMGVTGTYGYSTSVYGCSYICPYEKCSHLGALISFANNIIAMIIFYAVILIKFCRKRKQIYESEISDYMRFLKSISITLLILITAYLVFLVAAAAGRGFFLDPTPLSFRIRIIASSIYWWMYGINFFIFFTTSPRIREAYRRFLKDMWKKISKRSDENQEITVTETSLFWIGLRSLEHGKAKKDITVQI